MIRLLLLWLPLALLPNLAKANHFVDTDPPDCDTLTMTNGKTYLVLVGWQGEREIQYQLCDDQSGRVYAIQRDSIRTWKRYNKRNKVDTALPTPQVLAPQKRTLLRDTFDLLTLTNGKTYRAVILVRDYLSIYYRLYDDPLDDRQYCVPNRDVRSLWIAKSHRTIGQRKGSGCLVALSIVIGLILLIGLASIG